MLCARQGRSITDMTSQRAYGADARACGTRTSYKSSLLCRRGELLTTLQSTQGLAARMPKQLSGSACCDVATSAGITVLLSNAQLFRLRTVLCSYTSTVFGVCSSILARAGCFRFVRRMSSSSGLESAQFESCEFYSSPCGVQSAQEALCYGYLVNRILTSNVLVSRPSKGPVIGRCNALLFTCCDSPRRGGHNRPVFRPTYIISWTFDLKSLYVQLAS
jgi:hypothetical protein